MTRRDACRRFLIRDQIAPSFVAMTVAHPNVPSVLRVFAALVVAGSTMAYSVALPSVSTADPAPAPPVTTQAPPPAVAADPGAGVAPSGTAAPGATAVDPNAGRIEDAVGGFSFVLPAGWVESDATHLDYGSVLLSKTTGEPAAAGQAPPVANDTRVLMGRLDQKLYASGEATDAKAAVRLSSDMGEFFMPFPGSRLNQQTIDLSGNGLPGNAAYYEVKFTDPAKPTGQIWAGVVGEPSSANPPQRWFVVWLGTGNNPVDQAAAKSLAESVRGLGVAPAYAVAAPSPAAPAPVAAPSPAAPAPAEAPAPVAAPSPAAPAPAAAPAPVAAPSPTAPAPAAPEVAVPVPPSPAQAPVTATATPASPAPSDGQNSH